MSETIAPNLSTPHRYTLGEAAKAVGRSKAAISRAISNHTISAEKQPNGSYKIDPAELHRVYPLMNGQQQEKRVTDPAELNAQNRELRAKLDAATQRLQDKDSVIDDLREDRDRWRTQAEKLLLTDQRAIVTPPPHVPASSPHVVMQSGEPAAGAKKRRGLFGLLRG
jgi:hypothetical protein